MTPVNQTDTSRRRRRRKDARKMPSAGMCGEAAGHPHSLESSGRRGPLQQERGAPLFTRWNKDRFQYGKVRVASPLIPPSSVPAQRQTAYSLCCNSGLFDWSMKFQDGTKPTGTINPEDFTPERRAWWVPCMVGAVQGGWRLALRTAAHSPWIHEELTLVPRLEPYSASGLPMNGASNRRAALMSLRPWDRWLSWIAPPECPRSAPCAWNSLGSYPVE